MIFLNKYKYSWKKKQSNGREKRKNQQGYIRKFALDPNILICMMFDASRLWTVTYHACMNKLRENNEDLVERGIESVCVKKKSVTNHDPKSS